MKEDELLSKLSRFEREELPADALESHSRRLLSRLREATGLPVRIIRVNQDVNPFTRSSVKEFAQIFPSAAYIIVPRGQPEASGLFHELLHVERYWLKHIPQLFPVNGNPAFREIAEVIENEYEHVFILQVQQEAQLLPIAYWQKHYVTLLERSRQKPWTAALHSQLLGNCVLLRKIPVLRNSQIEATLESVLSRISRASFDDHINELTRLLDDKHQYVTRLLGIVGIQSSQFRMLQFKPPAHQFVPL